MDKVRIDKWLWAARFYKTRSLASEDIAKGRVQVNGVDVKPARDVKQGDTVSMRHNAVLRTVVVHGISDKRGPAPVAQQLYEETAQSLQQRQQAAEERRMGTEPALSLVHGRPTKQDRRKMQDAWGSRWSATADS